ncbi:aldo/keto reductase [Streptomyces sp. C]|uniref:aldo/keto reductase n=1 Tax=Streptomyces sp. C TaxID=253839 RepID=UPI0002D4A668|nr:aldo/keto reductase [Streptomyces sp. C]
MTVNAETGRGGGRLLYGCMGLGGSWEPGPYGPRDVDAAEEAVHAALDIGITVFDHADIYRHGKAEAVFGEVLARTPGLRERVTLQTKCGIRLPGGDGGPGMYDLRGPAFSGASRRAWNGCGPTSSTCSCCTAPTRWPTRTRSRPP